MPCNDDGTEKRGCGRYFHLRRWVLALAAEVVATFAECDSKYSSEVCTKCCMWKKEKKEEEDGRKSMFCFDNNANTSTHGSKGELTDSITVYSKQESNEIDSCCEEYEKDQRYTKRDCSHHAWRSLRCGEGIRIKYD